MASPEGYFHRPAVKALVERLAALRDVVFYVGAGASIERTGLTWDGLTAELLSAIDASGDYSSRIERVRSSSALVALSAIEEHFREEFEYDWRDRMRQFVSDRLYRGADYRIGAKNTNVDNYYDVLVGLCLEIFNAGGRATIVTPNYDDFLVEALDSAFSVSTVGQIVPAVVGYGVSRSSKASGAQKSHLRSVLKDREKLVVIYIHGYARRPRPDDAPALAFEKELINHYPVVSEADYALTRAQSRSVLEEVFRGRSVIVLGSSVTDAPLIDALIRTRSSRKKRQSFAIVPLHKGLLDPRLEQVNEIRAARFEALGTQYVCPDYYFQSRQLLDEWKVELQRQSTPTDRLPYSDPAATHRYGQRLVTWWQRRLSASPDPLVERQRDAYSFLKDVALPYGSRELFSR